MYNSNKKKTEKELKRQHQINQELCNEKIHMNEKLLIFILFFSSNLLMYQNYTSLIKILDKINFEL